MDYFLKLVESIGFSGVQNFPTVGLFDGNFRQNLEETGMGYGYALTEIFTLIYTIMVFFVPINAIIFLVLMISLEVEVNEKANKLGLLTTYAFNQNEAAEMAKAGTDIIVAHMELNIWLHRCTNICINGGKCSSRSGYS